MNLIQHLRFSMRIIARTPWFSAAIVATLALGIGVNTTVFSLVNAVLLKPLPFPGGERLVILSANTISRGDDFVNVSYPDYRDFKQGTKSFERLEAFSGMPFNISERGNPPERYRGGRISAGLFDMLQMRPIQGRGFLAADEKPGAVPVILLSHGVWRDRYGQNPQVIGRSVRVNEKPAVIVGVMPPDFKFPNNEDVWMAAAPNAEMERRTNRAFFMVGMLKPGASIPEAQADASVVARRLEQQFPDSHKDKGARVQTFHQAMNGGPIRLVFLLMLGAVGFVLLIACANVANMLLSRAVTRTREMSIRAAMGASRWQIIRQLLTESVLMAALGGIIGLSLATLGTRAFGMAVQNVGKPYWINFDMNYTVFGYFAALTILSGLIFGLAPALAASKVDLSEALKEGSRSAGTIRGGYLSGALVVLQFTLAVVLLSGAGLMMRSFLVAQNEFAGLQPERVLIGRVSLPTERYAKPEERRQFFEKLMLKLQALPGAQMATLVSNPPGSGSSGWRFEIEGQPIAEASRRPAASGVVAWKGYLQLLGLSLARGRDFEDIDGTSGHETVIVSQRLVTRFFPRTDPIGKRMRLFDNENRPKAWMTIIGIAPDLRQNDPSNPSPDPLILVPYRFDSFNSMTAMVRTAGAPAAAGSAMRAAVQELDIDLPLADVRSLSEHFGRSRWYLRVFGTLFLIFAVVAMGMAAMGIYAVMAHATNRRTQEIGVRMALGATVGTILRLVMRRGVIQVAIGMVLGLGAALAVCRLMARLLFQVSPSDPLTFTVVGVTLGLAGLASCWFPARRAASLDPVKALRYE